MRIIANEVVMSREEYDQIQEALRKRTLQMKGQLPPVPPPSESKPASLAAPAKYFCPTCNNFRGSAQAFNDKYLGDCMHRVWRLEDLESLSARQAIVQELALLISKYDIAILNVREVNDLLAGNSDAIFNRDTRIAELERLSQSQKEQIDRLNDNIVNLVKRITEIEAEPFRAERKINL